MIRFTKAKMLQKAKPRSRGDKKSALDKLYSFLSASEPQAIEFLVSFWNTQAQGVTYKELREAYLAGEITPQLYQRWTEDYSRFIQDKLATLWGQAAQAGAAEVSAKYPHFVYEPSISAAMGFIKDHGAELVTNITEEQRRALNAVISHISGYTAITPDEAARIIRPTVGLTVGQTLANARHRKAVEDAYLKAHPNCNPETAKQRAAESAARYAGRQHRYRAQNIARTELAFAYNAGHYGATKDAQAQGYIGDCTKTYLTADDERVCRICGALDGEKRNMDELFSFGKLLPPAHPSCRCAVAYEEIPGANLTIASESGIMESPEGTGQSSPGVELNLIINPAGRVVQIVDQSEVKLTGEPDSITQVVSKKGGITRNYYGHDGKQTKQISNNDHGHKKESKLGKHGEHAHDYRIDENGHLQHDEARELTAEERKENSDIL